MKKLSALIKATALALMLCATGLHAQTILPGFAFVPPGKIRSIEPQQGGCAGALCKKLQSQISAGCSGERGIPYADTIFLRQSISTAGFEDIAKDVALAMLAQDSETAHGLLEPHFAHEMADIRYAGALHLLLSIYHTSGSLTTQAARHALQVMETAAPQTTFPPSDFYFFDALSSHRRGDNDHAQRQLSTALDLEPDYFNAHALLVKLRLEQATKANRFGPSRCTKSYQGLFVAAANVMDLDPCPMQAAHLEIYLSRRIANPTASLPLQSLRVYLSLLAKRTDIAQQARALAGQASASCQRYITAELAELFEAVDDP